MDEVTGEPTPTKSKSLQLRFVATVAVLMLALTSVIVAVTVRGQSQTSREDLETRVVTTSELVAIEAEIASARGDTRALRAIGEFLRNQEGVESAFVLDADGSIVANDTQNPELIGTVLDDPSGVIARSVARIGESSTATIAEFDGRLYTAQPIVLDGEHVRTVTFITSLEEVGREVRSVLIRGVLLGIVFVALGVVVTSALMKRVTRPLIELTEAAEHLSLVRLPALVQQMRVDAEDEQIDIEPLPDIEVHSDDEIGRLADAFNSIQATATAVATEQGELLNRGISDIFVQLARRNQSLIDRQIEVIDSLEESERSPDALAGLFKLDHLAARMRRNAESLLVLAGESQTNVRARPASMTDVIRVAVGEVEQYHRVEVVDVAPIMVKGGAASGLAHLLAELLDNALRNSPEATRVNVSGERHGNGHYVIEISDQGVGLNSEQLAEYNKHLANPPKMGLSLAKSLGFTVVGRLAKQFDARVVLRPSAGGGLSAFIRVPKSQLAIERKRSDRDPAVPQDRAKPEERAPSTIGRKANPRPMSDAPAIDPRPQPAVSAPSPVSLPAPTPTPAPNPAPAPAPSPAPASARDAEPAAAASEPPPITLPTPAPIAAPAPMPTPEPASTLAATPPPVLPSRTPTVAEPAPDLPVRGAPLGASTDLPTRTPVVEPAAGAAAPPLPTRRRVVPESSPVHEPQPAGGASFPASAASAGGPARRTAPGGEMHQIASRERPSRQRSPEELRRMLNSYRRGLDRSRPEEDRSAS